MQQKGRTEQILERLQEMINNGQGSLAPGKVSLPKEELSRLVLELSLTMETELKQYRDITDKRAKVLKDAKKQAEDIIYEAEQSASRIRVSGRKTDVAPVRLMDLTETERRSLDNANEIYAASLIYTDEMMAEMQDVIADAYEKISASYEYVLEDLRQKSEIIVANRQELMADLQSMEKEDRYQQILEIGQLLSEELYYARKGRMGENSVQEEVAEDAGQQVSAGQTAENAVETAGAVSVVEAMKQAAKAAKQAGMTGDVAEAVEQTGALVDVAGTVKQAETLVDAAGAAKQAETLVDAAGAAKQAETLVDAAGTVKQVEPVIEAVEPEGMTEMSDDAEKPEEPIEVSGDVTKQKKPVIVSGNVAKQEGPTEISGNVSRQEKSAGVSGDTGDSKDSPKMSGSTISPVIPMDPAMQQDVAAAVASALEEKKRADGVTHVRERRAERPMEDKKVEVAEITKEVSEAVKKDPQQTISNSVIEAMKRAAKKAVLGLDDDEDDIFLGEFDEEDEDVADEAYRTPTQPLDTKEINRRAKQEEETPKTPEQIKEEKHRDFVEAHEEKVRAEEQKWLNAVYNPVIPDANAVDPIVAMVLQEKEAAKKHDV